jgi:hypothetical protein
MEGKDFLLRALAPLVAVTSCSQSTASIEKNKIKSLAEFFKPFGERLKPVDCEDYQGNPQTIDPCYIRFVDINEMNALDLNDMHEKFRMNILPQYQGDEFKLPALKDKLSAEKYREEGSFY